MNAEVDPTLFPGGVLVRESRLILVLWSLPGLLLFTCFFGAYFGMLANAGPHSRAYVRLAGQQIQIPAGEGIVVLRTFGLFFVALLLFTVASRLRRAASTTVFLGGSEATVSSDNKAVRIDLASLAIARVTRLPLGNRLRMGRGTPAIVLSDADALRVVAHLRAAGVNCRTNEAFDRIDVAALTPGEVIRWSGHPGWRGFSVTRLYLVTMVAPPILIFAAWLWHIWSSPGADVATRLFYTFIASVVVGTTAIGCAMLLTPLLRDWACDVFGDLAVTDRRIVWRAPLSGRIYREIESGELLDAFLVEERSGRGWIGLRLDDGKGNVKESDLYGVPEPERALAHIMRLIQPA